jgi:hypothetical protein
MSLSAWFVKMLCRRRHFPTCRPSTPRRFRPRLLVEPLEYRTLPSTLTVLNTLDNGAGSLRAAIAAASSGDTILFAPSLNGQAITLTSGELAIGKNLDIEGPGACLLALSGNNKTRVFDIGQGVTATIAGLTITHGRAQAGRTDSSNNGGGAILNVGTLTVANDLLSANESETHGGAITNGPAAVLTVINSIFSGNQVTAKVNANHVEGGAIYQGGGSNGLGAGAATTILGCSFIDNRAVGGSGQVSSNAWPLIGSALGGALHNDGLSTMTVQNSTFLGNQAIGGSGNSAGKNAQSAFLGVGAGGAITGDEGAVLVVSGCTFAYNQALGGSNNTGTSSGYIGAGRGGALSVFSGAATLTNNIFIGNEALGGNGNTGGTGALLVGVGDGGAIARDPFGHVPYPSTVSNCTFTNNQAIGGAGNRGGIFVGDGRGGALSNFSGSTTTVTGSTFSGNQAIGGNGAAGANGRDGLGGALSNLLGSTLIVSNCTLTGNQALGGAGGTGGNGGNGFGGGLFNDGFSIAPENAGTPATLTVTGCAITDNHAAGGAASAGGSAGQGVGGGAYFTAGVVVCLDVFTQGHVKNNHASTSADDLFGTFTTCP